MDLDRSRHSANASDDSGLQDLPEDVGHSADAAARLALGQTHFENGDTDDAVKAYQDAVRLTPTLSEPNAGRILEAWILPFPSWAATGAGDCRILAPAEALKLPHPAVLPIEEARYWTNRKPVERVPEIFVGRIDHAEVIIPEFTVLAQDGCFFVDGFTTSPLVYVQKGGVIKYSASDKRVLLDLPCAPIELGTACILLGRSNNYFHFLLESLPRIWAAEQYGVDERVPALVPDDLHRTELEFLALLGFDSSKLIAVPNHTSIRCRTLYAPSIFGHGYVVSPLAVRCVRERVLGRVGEISGLPKRVYLSRNRMSRRHVYNEAELLARLESHGFCTVYPEELGMAEQVQLFARAEAILSPDSSALANLAFVSAGSKVGVFNTRGLYKPLWHGIACHVGADLTYIHADSVVESNSSLAHRDMRVAPAVLDAWLDQL